MKNKRRFWSFTFAVIAVGSLLISCRDMTESKSGSIVTEQSNEENPAEETLFAEDSLPDDLDFGGQTITVLYREEEADEFFMEAQTGDVVDDAVYRSNHNVRERLNIELAVVKKRGNAEDDRTAFINYVVDTVKAGDDAFQLVACLTYNMPSLIQNGVLLNLLDVQYLDFGKPWWAQGLIEYGTLGGKLFFASGDISLSLLKKTFCLYFNIDLLNDYGLESPYEKVHAGTWTKEVLSKMAVSAYKDLNGSSTADLDDQYGFALYDRNHCNIFIGGFDLQVTEKDENGYPAVVFGSEKVADAVTWLCALFHNNNGIYYNKNSDAGTDLSVHESLRKMFNEGRLLFISAEFSNAVFFRDMKYEFGVLPPPKWDESQKGYYTLARNIYSSFGIPVTVQNTDPVGAVMEAIASENHRTLSPVYYETALKVKYSRDAESAQMFDIIKGGVKFNFGYTYHLIVGLTDHFVGSVRDNKPNWVSTYASIEPAAVSSIGKFIESIENA